MMLPRSRESRQFCIDIVLRVGAFRMCHRTKRQCRSAKEWRADRNDGPKNVRAQSRAPLCGGPSPVMSDDHGDLLVSQGADETQYIADTIEHGIWNETVTVGHWLRSDCHNRRGHCLVGPAPGWCSWLPTHGAREETSRSPISGAFLCCRSFHSSRSRHLPELSPLGDGIRTYSDSNARAGVLPACRMRVAGGIGQIDRPAVRGMLICIDPGLLAPMQRRLVGQAI